MTDFIKFIHHFVSITEVSVHYFTRHMSMMFLFMSFFFIFLEFICFFSLLLWHFMQISIFFPSFYSFFVQFFIFVDRFHFFFFFCIICSLSSFLPWLCNTVIVCRPCLLVMDSLKLSYHDNVCRLIREWVPPQHAQRTENKPNPHLSVMLY